VGLFLLHVLPFASRPALIGGDEAHYALMAHSIATDGDFDLADDYEEVAAGAPWAGGKRAGQTLDRHLIRTGDREVFAHPVGLPVFAAPLIAVQQWLAPGSAPDLVLGLLALAVTFSALVAGCRGLGTLLNDPRRGALIGLAAYFSSPRWYYSRTFLTEPFIWAWSVLSLVALQARRMILASVFLGLALAMKETAVLIVGPILALAVLALGIRRAWMLCIGPALAGVLFVLKNVWLGLEPLATFQPYRIGNPLEGLVGFLIDPTRGLLWFAPLLSIAILGWWSRGGGRAQRLQALGSAIVFLSYFLVSACWIDWRGGSGYGPRLLVPVLPALIFPLVQLQTPPRGRFLQVLLAASFVFGFAVNCCAALNPVPAFWSISVADVLTKSPVATFALAAIAGIWQTVVRLWSSSATSKV
jgi:hypothetical protein